MKISSPHDQGQQHAGVDQRSNQLFAEGERNALEADVAFQHFLQVAGSLAGQQGGGVHDRKAALGLEGGGERLLRSLRGWPRLRAGRRKWRSSGSLPSICSEPRMGRPARIRVRNCWLKMRNVSSLTFAARHAGQAAARLDGEHVIAGMGEAGAQLLGGGRGLHLLHHSAAFIGQLDDKLCHALIPGSPDLPGRWFACIPGKRVSALDSRIDAHLARSVHSHDRTKRCPGRGR